MRLLLFLSVASVLMPAAMAAGPQWPAADAPRFWMVGDGGPQISAEVAGLYSKENYDRNSVIVTPTGMDHVAAGAMRVNAGFGILQNFSLFGQLSANSVFSSNSETSRLENSSNYGLGDAFLALRWLVFRSVKPNRKFPTEWETGSFSGLVEGSWNFPLYNNTSSTKPPLGNHSNDFTGMARGVWYTNRWLALSFGAGYTYRTENYDAEIPYILRADILLPHAPMVRFFTDFSATEFIPNSKHRDLATVRMPFLNGSALYQMDDVRDRHGRIGIALQPNKEWEVVHAFSFSTSGMNTAKTYAYTIGVSWRPVGVPFLSEPEFEKRRETKIEEPIIPRRTVFGYGLKATVLKVSSRGNFLKIAYGKKDGVKPGNTFYVYEPDDLSGRDRPILATAKAVAVKEDESYLKIEERFDKTKPLAPGFEVQQVLTRD